MLLEFCGFDPQQKAKVYFNIHGNPCLHRITQISESVTWDGFQFHALQRYNGFEIQNSYKPSFQGNPIKSRAAQFIKCNDLGRRKEKRVKSLWWVMHNRQIKGRSMGSYWIRNGNRNLNTIRRKGNTL
ncbi:unnamed protein product [Lactuca virosa]|uniref:Uncharacterized protein n=1 Tax=Lactuca virosa TaxID=75947 RepID=A0AAU9P3H8_9ASTR|nr:unnamed protein product [Lactuca virosa]